MAYRMTTILAVAAAAATLAVAPARATTTIGGYAFADDAFADAVTASSGSYSLVGGTTLSGVLTDRNPTSYAKSTSAGGFLDVAFANKVVVNGPGNDLVLFELGAPDAWNVTINGVTLAARSTFTGETVNRYLLNAAALDLSLFGVAAGGTISTLHLSFVPANGSVASTSAVGALHTASVASVPEVATWAMMVAGFGFVGASLRGRRSRVAFV